MAILQFCAIYGGACGGPTAAPGLCCMVWLNPMPPVELDLCGIPPAAWAARVQSLAELLPLDDKGVSQLRAWCNLLIYKDCIQRRFFSLLGYGGHFQRGEASLL